MSNAENETTTIVVEEEAQEFVVASAPEPVVLKPAMTAKEVALYKETLKDKKFLVEYGVGGSTLLAFKSGINTIWSTDSSQEWLDNIRNHPELGAAVAKKKLHLFHADLGQLRQWGFPAGMEAVKKWPGYPMQVWEKLGERAEQVDVVLVDGRFRIASALVSLLFTRPEVPVVIHDFERTHYHVVLEFTDTIASCERLVVLKKKSDLNMRRLMRVLFKHILDPN